MVVVLNRACYRRVRSVDPGWRHPGRILGVGPQPRRHTGPSPAAGKIAAATAQDSDGTGAATNTRPNARQPTKANTRQAENSNTRQPAQVINGADDNGDSPNTRQAQFQMHVKSADVHLSPGAANKRQPLDAGAAFNYEAQLFRLETYKDKYGRTICKRTVRFARRRTGRNVGEVTPELAEAL